MLPEPHGETWLFREVDVARVELILEIRHEYAIDDEAAPLALGLLDQVSACAANCAASATPSPPNPPRCRTQSSEPRREGRRSAELIFDRGGNDDWSNRREILKMFKQKRHHEILGVCQNRQRPFHAWSVWS